MSNTKIIRCTCAHAGQDALHGQSRRVHNELAQAKDRARVWRCTVCGRERETSTPRGGSDG